MYINYLETNNTSSSYEDYSSFFAPINPQTSNTTSTSESTLIRLQNLADSLPTQIYDRNGNLVALNTSQPPMSFFEIDTTGGASKIVNATMRAVPIFQREHVNWGTVTLTSILKKIVPEEAFLSVKTSEDDANKETTADTASTINTVNNSNTRDNTADTTYIVFNQLELRLLDKDQLTVLAKHFNISIDQSDTKIEQELLKSVYKSSVKRNIMKNAVSKEKISWTAENEGLLVKIYEELRGDKQKVDQKLQMISGSHTSTCATSLKRGNGASDRGLWAVLADQFKQAAKIHVSVSECRNKLVILKRLKTN